MAIDASVIVASYNRKDVLVRCLSCLASQTYQADKFEIIVVDDGSSDGTAEMLAALTFPCQFLSIILPQNIGLAAAHNVGIAQASGEIVIFIDSDIFVPRQFIAEHMVICLLMISRKLFHQPTIFLALSKSQFKRGYSWPELFLLRRLAYPVLTRDAFTMDILCRRHINCSHMGNPLMDGLTSNKVKLAAAPLVGLLPGSREEAYGNFRRICQVVQAIPSHVKFACALPPSLNTARICEIVASDGWQLFDDILLNDKHAIHLVRNGFEDIINAAEVIIGLAGTANEQAAGLGKPVVSFTGCGPQTTRRRMLDQQRMLGGTAKFTDDFPHGVVREVCELLGNADLRANRGQMGKRNMGEAGVSRKIAEYLIASVEG